MKLTNLKPNLTLFFFILTISLAQAQSIYTLPDGNTLEEWTDQTEYSKTYYVNQNHPNASDENPGTETQPFKTINKAAQVVKAGEKVLVFSGVYREQIKPAEGGNSEKEMVLYEVAPGNKVVVKGTKIFKEEWVQSRDAQGEDWAHNLWQAPLNETEFPPFYIQNANEEEITLMPWAERWRNKIPYTLGRGLVFQNGIRLQQLAVYEDLNWVKGSFWVDHKRNLVHIHPFDDENPNEKLMELTDLQQLFVPTNVGEGFIHLKGFEFAQVGNGYPRVGVGAVFVNGGHHWIIENNTVHHCGSVGIEIGARITERAASSKKENKRVNEHVGGFIVNNNEVYECGTGGIQGHTVRKTIMEGNHIHHIGWQHVERYWECAGIKVLLNIDVVAAKNTIHDVTEASAIWFDWDNKNSRISQNVIYDIGATKNGAIFIEASNIPNMVDNNFIWKVRGPGVSLYDTDNSTVSHNLIAFAQTAISSRINTDRMLNGVKLSSKNNNLTNNIFYHNYNKLVVDSDDNNCNYNVFVGDDLKEWQKRPFDKNSWQFDLNLNWDKTKKELTLTTEKAIPLAQKAPQCNLDLWDKERSEQTLVGPWNTQAIGEIVYKMKW